METYYNPLQVVLVSSRGDMKVNFSAKTEQKDNIAAVSWHTPLSYSPFLYGIVLGKGSLTHKLIESSNVFTVNFIPHTLKKEALYCGSNTGEYTDKFKEAGLTKEENEKIDCPRIKQAISYLGCEVINPIDLGQSTLFIGKVIETGKKKGGKRLFHLKENRFTTTR